MLAKGRRDFLLLALGRVLQVAVLLVGIKVSTHYLSPAEIGNLYVVVTVTNFFGLFFINPIGQYVNRHTHEWNAADILVSKLFVYNFYIFAAALLSACVVSVLPIIGVGSAINYCYFLLVVPLFVYFNTWNQTLAPMLNLLGHRVAFIALTLASAALAVFISFLLVSFYTPSGIFWVIGQTLAFSVLSAVSLVCFLKTIRQRVDFSAVRNDFRVSSFRTIFAFAFPLAIGVLFLWVQGQSYRLVLERYLGLEFLGYFGVGMTIASAIANSFETLLMQWLSPSLYKSMKNSAAFPSFFTSVINFVLPMYFFLALFVSFLSVYLVALLVGEKYAQSCMFLMFGIWAEFFRMATNLVAVSAHAKMHTRSLIIPYAVGGIGTLVGVYMAVHSSIYEWAVPSVLVVMAGLAFFVMFKKMNRLMTIRLYAGNFFRMLAFSLVFTGPLIFYSNAPSAIVSFVVLVGFGSYFLAVIYFYSRKEGGAKILNTEISG